MGKPMSLWVEDKKDEGEFGYDFWYQPYHNVMISTEWGHPRSFFQGLNMEHVEGGHYGTHLNVYDWTTRKLLQKIDLGMEGVMPLEIRFLHAPRQLLVLSAALSSQTCSGSSKLRRATGTQRR